MSQKWKLIKIDIFNLEWKDDEVKMTDRPCSFRDLENSLFSPRQLRVEIFWKTSYHWKSFYAGYSFLTDNCLKQVLTMWISIIYIVLKHLLSDWIKARDQFYPIWFVLPNKMNSGIGI